MNPARRFSRTSATEVLPRSGCTLRPSDYQHPMALHHLFGIRGPVPPLATALGQIRPILADSARAQDFEMGLGFGMDVAVTRRSKFQSLPATRPGGPRQRASDTGARVPVAG